LLNGSTLARVLHKRKITKQVIERRVLDICFADVIRFEGELNSFFPLFEQLVFLDEMSTDNRSMLRKCGWFLQNQRPFFRGIFQRGKRHSILAFLGVSGLFEVFMTDSTFDGLVFFSCVKELLASGKVEPYPGKHSVWILDGASIHMDHNMIDYLWLAGIYVIFLPAYCPFFNPIEIMFGLVKREC
jgi:DDE superfamily endonuclease